MIIRLLAYFIAFAMNVLSGWDWADNSCFIRHMLIFSIAAVALKRFYTVCEHGYERSM